MFTKGVIAAISMKNSRQHPPVQVLNIVLSSVSEHRRYFSIRLRSTLNETTNSLNKRPNLSRKERGGGVQRGFVEVKIEIPKCDEMQARIQV